MDYTHTSDEQRASMLQSRLAQLEAEHYQHEISKKIAARLVKKEKGDRKREAEAHIQAAEEAQATIDAAYEGVKAELAALEAGGAT